MNLHSSQKSIPWSNIRWLTAVMGAILFILGQIQIAGSTIQAAAPTSLGTWLTEIIHLGVPDIDNVIIGLPVLFTGVLLLVVSLRGLYLLPSDPFGTVEDRPPAFRFVFRTWPWLLVSVLLAAFLLIQLNRLDYGVLSPILWVLSLLIFLSVMAFWDHQRQVDLSPHLSRNDLLWMIGLLITGLLIGTYRLQGWPDQLIGDEGNFWTIARDIAAGKFSPPIFGSGVYSFPILSSILQAGIMRLFGISLWGWRMASVLPGILTVIPLYLLARDAFNRRVAVIASVILLTSPYFLAFSRLGYNNIQTLFITTLAVYWVYIGLQRNSYCLMFLGGIATSLGFYTYFGARGTIVIALLFIAIMTLTRQVRPRQALVSGAVLLLAAALTTGPYFVYGLHQDSQTMGFKTFESVFFNVFNGRQFYSDAELFKYAPIIKVGGNELFFNPKVYAVLFSQGLIRTLLAFQKPGLISEHYIAFPLAGTVGVFFFLIGLGLAIRNWKEPRHQLVLLWFLTCVIAFSALNTVPPRHTHMVALIPALALLTAAGVNATAEVFRAALGKVRQLGPIAASILCALVALGGLYDFFVQAPAKYPPQPDQIMSWAALDSHGESFVYIYQENSQKDFKPYIISEFLPNIPFKAISTGQLAQAAVNLPLNQKTIVFYPPTLSTTVEPILQHKWGELFSKRLFTVVEGTPVLSAGMNTPFVFERDRALVGTFVDAFQHGPFIVTLLVLLIIWLLIAFLPSPCAMRLPGKLGWVLDWFNRPPQPEAAAVLPEETILIPEKSLEIVSKPLVDAVPELVDQLSEPSHPSRLLPAHFPNTVLLVASIFLAFAAQLTVLRHAYIPAIILYGLCAVGLWVWSRRNTGWPDLFPRQVQLSRRMEIILSVILLLSIAFTRFYDLKYRVYGLEADETKWTVQSWYSAILHVDQGDFATAHYQYLPVSFWVRSAFLRLFGLNFLSARIESAFLSLVSAVLFYFLVRRLSNSPPMAWLSTALYSFSFVELSASHQALHNTTVEAWMIGGLFLTVLALQEAKWWQFLLAGIVLGLGMLTYETFFPTPLIAALILLGTGIYRIAKKKEPLVIWLKRLLIFLWPIVFLFFMYIWKYLGTQGFQFAALDQSTNHGTAFTNVLGFMWKNLGILLKTLFAQVVWTDSLVYWGGPFLNPWLIVFSAIGFFYNLVNLRRPYFFIVPLWFLINILYAPLIAGTVWPRVLYTALGPLVIWGAMGLWTFLAALRAWLEALKVKAAAPLFLLLLAVILINDYHIFTSDLLDPTDRQKRRELADLTAQSTSAIPMTLFPYAPNQDDPVLLESHVLLFSAAGARRTGLDAPRYYQTLTFDQVLPTLYQDRQTAGINLIYDKTAANLEDIRSSYINVILRCYSANLQASGRFFDVYHIDPSVLADPACYQGPLPTPVFPPAEVVLLTSPETLEWNSNGLQVTDVALKLEQKLPNTYWIEVEDAFQGPGWAATSEFVNGFFGHGFLFDYWNAEAARYSLQVAEAGRYKVWVRSYKRQQNDQVNAITIQDRVTKFAPNSTTLNAWVWEDVGTYSLPAGPLPLSLTRTYGLDEEFSVFIDTILVTPDLTHHPEKLPIWVTVLDTGRIHLDSNTYTLSKPLSPGEYRWSVRLFDRDRLIDSNGVPGVASPLSGFIIR